MFDIFHCHLTLKLRAHEVDGVVLNVIHLSQIKEETSKQHNELLQLYRLLACI